ncbi:MAG: OmpA family protein [Candidatus Thiodiazotropha sp.]
MAFSLCRNRDMAYFVAVAFCSLLLTVKFHALYAVELEDQRYMAGMHDAEWSFSGSGFSCELAHEVPQFGIARFRRLAGEDLHFLINSFQPVPEAVEGVVNERSPAWEHNPPDPIRHPITIQSGLRPMTLPRKRAGWLLTSLTKGQVGSFAFPDWDDSRRQVRVELSPVNFQKPYREFKRCLRQLPARGGFSAMRHSTLHFALDVDRLDDNGAQQLEQLAAYIKADERISRITIEGHADDQGSSRYNKGLSARRAANVYRYLKNKGIKGGTMIQRSYGESRPKIAKRSESARAANRRVEIKLQR